MNRRTRLVEAFVSPDSYGLVLVLIVFDLCAGGLAEPVAADRIHRRLRPDRDRVVRPAHGWGSPRRAPRRSSFSSSPAPWRSPAG